MRATARPTLTAPVRLATLAGVFAACGESPAVAPATIVRDSAGIPIVENRGVPAPPFALGDSPIVRIGVVSGAEKYQFGSISGLARLSDGRIVVLDGMSKELRFFSADGDHLQSVGGEGFGPGEFQSGGGLDVLPGDTLQVEDFPWRTRFAPDGTLLFKEQVDWGRVRRLGTFYAECPFRRILLGDDIIACAPSETIREAGADLVAIRAQTYVRIPSDYSRVDTLAAVLRRSVLGMFRRGNRLVAEPTPGSDMMLGIIDVIAYAPSGFSAFGGSPTRFAAGRTDRYSIDVYDLDGTLRRIVRRAEGTRPPTREELHPLPRHDEPPPGMAMDAALFENPDFSNLTPVDSVSALRSLFIDDLNRIWAGLGTAGDAYAGRAQPADEGAGAHAVSYDVFDPDGRYLGPVYLPDRFSIWQIGADFVLGVRRDEMNVEFVEMYRLTRT